jgi:hypothetical protein
MGSILFCVYKSIYMKVLQVYATRFMGRQSELIPKLGRKDC